MWRLEAQQPATISLGNQSDTAFEWIDCRVAEVGAREVTLRPRQPLYERTRVRLTGGELAYLGFEHHGAPVAVKGIALASPGDAPVRFVLVDRLDRDLDAPSDPPSGAIRESVLRLMYVSQAAPGLSESHLGDILAVATRRNRAAQITGALCLRYGFFAQILEGPQAEVLATYARIQRDGRHHEPVIVCEERSTHRLYGGWQMRGIDGNRMSGAAQELTTRLRLAHRPGDADLTRRWLKLLQSDSSPQWTADWLAAQQSVLFLRGLLEDTAPAAPAGS